MKIITAKELERPFQVAVVVSRFNKQVTNLLCEGAVQRLKELEIPNDHVTIVWVPGAVEIPITVKHLAKTQRYSAIITLGAVIRGETGHYDFVCKQVSDGCLEVALEYCVPVIFGVLTTDNLEQALERAGGNHSHAGRDSVDAAFEMVSVLAQIGGEKIKANQFSLDTNLS
ncbi:MAG: 6,7-dimethyl-8-ribityllumazine synthase [Gammaproteobacteria bacterium]|nr:6,7-dimethyl-8-ribityllumazine synthase [Gammaproteobacteria bacterium]